MQKTMRKMALLAIILLIFLSPCVCLGEEDTCWSRLHAPYWHSDPDCRFAETDWMKKENLGEKSHQISIVQAKAEGQKPCPGCATAFKPTFTGDFPDWPHTLLPWGYEHGDMIDKNGWPHSAVELPYEIRSVWGMPTERLHALYPETWDKETGRTIYPDYPEDYAGLYMNACGCATFLLVDPTPERIAVWREKLEGEFWVISAHYSWNELQELANACERVLFADGEIMKEGAPSYFHIVSVSISSIANAVEIGVTPDDFDEGVVRIQTWLKEAGYNDAGMLCFFPTNYPSWQ